MKTLVSILNKWIDSCGDHVFIYDQDNVITYREFGKIARSIQLFLKEAGIKKGDSIAVSGPKTAALIASYLAAFGLGISVMPIPDKIYVNKLTELLNIVNLSGTFIDRESNIFSIEGQEIIIVGDKRGELNWLAQQEIDKLLKCSTSGEYLPLKSLAINLQVADRPFCDDLLNTNMPVYYNLTSGSTGAPKVAYVGNQEMIMNGLAVNKEFKLGQGESYVCMFPPEMHPHELFVKPILAGSSMALLTSRDLLNWGEHLKKKNVTQIVATPTVYETILKIGTAKEDWVNVKYAICTGETFSYGLKKKFYVTTGKKLISVWGSTETTGMTLVVPEEYEDHPEQLLGVPFDGYEVKCDEETNELLIWGEACFKGYLKRDNRNKFTADGFYRTGDMVQVVDNGIFQFIGRLNSVVKVSGRKVSIFEVEKRLRLLEGVSEAVAVVSVGDGGNVLGIFISLIDQTSPFVLEEKLVKDILGEIRFRVYILDELPKKSSGKIDREEIYKIFSEKLQS